MGSDWSWSLHLRTRLDEESVEDLLALAAEAGLSPRRPDGAINGTSLYPEPGMHHRLLSRAELVTGLASGAWATNLWNTAQEDVSLAVDPRRATVSYSSIALFESGGRPGPEADPHRRMHRELTDLWLVIAERFGAVFGSVVDELSLEHVWRWWPHDFEPPRSGAGPTH